uniref:Sulfakinin n=1 Tax=Timema shepardi TaxID=629360 RepID=A0A7R9FYL7_TIMSH|nr:unnamed protein product [Timema shepardi]
MKRLKPCSHDLANCSWFVDLRAQPFPRHVVYSTRVADGSRRISQMGHTTIAATFLTIVIYLLIQHQSQCYAHATSSNSESATSNGVSIGGSQRGARGRSLLLASRSSGPQQYMRAHLTPIESPADVMSDFLIDDEDVIDFNKRQSDDYGHMRFGKRGEQFDDYGHMRFGRSLD